MKTSAIPTGVAQNGTMFISCNARSAKTFYLFTFVFCLALSSALPALSQIPQGFNYQALAFDNSGELIRNQALPVRITIQSDSLGGTIFWYEEHAGVMTNPTGLFSLILGKGSKISGTASTFADIDWSVTPKFIKTEIDYGGWKDMGSSRLWSVPYAMTAGDITGSLKKLEVAGEATATDEVLFEVKNKNGRTVFAVYNEGVRIYVGDGGSKAVKGGFAIGGFDETKAGTQDLLVVNNDSVRVYIYDDPLRKSVKGGFAVGSYNPTEGLKADYFNVSAEVEAETITGEARVMWYPLKEAFLVGNVLIESKDSVGTNSWASGYQSKAVGNYSQALGYKAVSRGDNSTSIGYQTIANGGYSLAMGYNSTSPGGGSYAFGVASKSIGANSTAMGYYSIANGDYSMSTGFETKADGWGSSAYGYRTISSSGYETVLGSHNTIYEPNSTLWNWNDRLFVIGNGFDNDSRSNALTILKNGSIGLQSVEVPVYALELPNSSIAQTGQARAYAWTTYSDGRSKTEQGRIKYGLSEVMRLLPKSYFHHSTISKNGSIELKAEGSFDIGMVAQEVYEIIPEAVNKPENEQSDLWSLSYDKLVPVLVRAIQEQQLTIEALEERHRAQQTELETLRTEMESIKALLLREIK